MPLAILPASAQAFAPRSGPTIVLGSRVETWLTHSLKRINRVKRPLNSVSQHYRCLTETLSGPAALWTLASLMLPKAPDAELKRDSNPLVEAIFNYQLIHVEAYVVHVDMVSQNEVAFKLTQDSIDSLIDYHKDIYSVDVAASTWDWSDKDAQLRKLHQDFVQAINRYVYRTHVRALEGLEDDGAGELLQGRSEEVKNAIMGLFLPLLPPPPRIVDVVYPYAAPQSLPDPGQWWHPMPVVTSPTEMPPPPMEPWRVLGSTHSPSAASAAEAMSPWSNMAYTETAVTSPVSAYSQTSQPPFSQSSQQAFSQSSSPDYTQASEAAYTETTHAMTTADHFFSSEPAMAPITPLPLPSVLAQQCGASAGPLGGFDSYGWGANSNQMMQQFPISI